MGCVNENNGDGLMRVFGAVVLYLGCQVPVTWTVPCWVPFVLFVVCAVLVVPSMLLVVLCALCVVGGAGLAKGSFGAPLMLLVLFFTLGALWMW